MSAQLNGCQDNHSGTLYGYPCICTYNRRCTEI